MTEAVVRGWNGGIGRRSLVLDVEIAVTRSRFSGNPHEMPQHVCPGWIGRTMMTRARGIVVTAILSMISATISGACLV